jgi:hypothetical protein
LFVFWRQKPSPNAHWNKGDFCGNPIKQGV